MEVCLICGTVLSKASELAHTVNYTPIIPRSSSGSLTKKGMAQNLQFVWPKDTKKRRGFFGKLSDIVTGKGPDVFVQARGSRAAIPVERWANWSVEDRESWSLLM